ncbi:MAG: ATP-binding cassette domain-containing protein [Candidatus Humimicrobiaceae bacterium]
MISNNMILSISNLSKKFGDFQVLYNIKFEIIEGEILGLIGPNGSGKTTLLECLTCLLPIDSGIVYHKNEILNKNKIKEFMFYLPDAIKPYKDQRVVEVLDFFTSIYGRKKDDLNKVVDILFLGPVLYKKIYALSKGYLKRFLIAVALLTYQPVLLLDEPFDGLDFKQVQSVMSILKETSMQGRTLLLAIHQLSDAERICDRFLLIDSGKIIGIGKMEELWKQANLNKGSLEEIFVALM